MRALGTSAGLIIVALATFAPAPPATAAGQDGTRAVLQRAMSHAGRDSGVLAIELDSGRPIYARRAATPRTPASVNKLNTTAALLRRFGPEATVMTQVLAQRAPQDGSVDGDLFLRGGGDPTFGPRQTRRLAAGLAATGLRRIRGRVIGDESLFDSRRGPPSESFRTSPWVGPLSALTFARGLTGHAVPRFQARPALFAAQQFELALRRRGVAVGRRARTGVTPAVAEPLLNMPSPPMRTLIARTNTPSDNFMAETLIKLLGARFTGSGTTASGASVVREAVGELGVVPEVVDGSGLSRANHESPADVVTLLRRMALGPDGPAFVRSLAVAGRTGTLLHRMRGTAADGRCRAKTGTLTGVSALAGYCSSATGGRVAFAFLMNGVDVATAHRLQDRMTVALAAYEPNPLFAARSASAAGLSRRTGPGARGSGSARVRSTPAPLHASTSRRP